MPLPYLQVNPPGVSFHDLQILINHPIRLINPGAIFLKEGEAINIIRSGLVECTVGKKYWMY